MLRASRTFPYKLLLPATVVMLAVVLFPLGYSFWLSFRNMSLYHFRDHTFVRPGAVPARPDRTGVWQMLAKSLIWTGVNVFFHVSLGVLLAVMLNGPVRGRTVFPHTADPAMGHAAVHLGPDWRGSSTTSTDR